MMPSTLYSICATTVLLVVARGRDEMAAFVRSAGMVHGPRYPSPGSAGIRALT